jgi:hypothetical protein
MFEISACGKSGLNPVLSAFNRLLSASLIEVRLKPGKLYPAHVYLSPFAYNSLSFMAFSSLYLFIS